jgi:nucleoredoxin
LARVFRGLAGIVLLFFCFLAQAGQLPLTTKEIGLMLRAGYSSKSVMQELAKRRFADTFDPDKESMLLTAGASPELIEALERGKYSVSESEAARVQAEMANKADRRAAEADRSRESEALYRSQLTRERGSKTQATSPNTIGEVLKGDLVHIANGVVVRADDESLASKKLIAVYFSAHWCGPCRKFTPQLVDYYNRVAQQHPEFELIFFSFDRSNYAMQNYMLEAKMPWPAIDYQKLEGKQAIRKYAGNGIPCLVLIDSTGKVISDSFAGSEYRGPGKVLADLDDIFAKGGGGHLATNR